MVGMEVLVAIKDAKKSSKYPKGHLGVRVSAEDREKMGEVAKLLSIRHGFDLTTDQVFQACFRKGLDAFLAANSD